MYVLMYGASDFILVLTRLSSVTACLYASMSVVVLTRLFICQTACQLNFHRYVNFHSLPSVFTQPDFYTVQRHSTLIVNLVKADHSKSFLPWKRLHVVSFCPGSCWVILKPGSCLFKTSFFGAPPSQCTHSATKINPLFLCFFIYSKRLLIRQMRW